MAWEVDYLFQIGNKSKPQRVRKHSLPLLHCGQCLICPLSKQSGFQPQHPKMPAHGSEQPLIYILGEAPGEEEDIQGQPFVGKAGQFLRRYIEPQWLPKLRWNNVVRTRPKDNATPDPMAIECCRPSVQADIERTRPLAIFALGDVALNWALGRSGISHWNGRQLPVRIGSHVCWLFPIKHPSYIVRLSGAAMDDDNMRRLFQEQQFVFQLDIQRAFKAVAAGLPQPQLHDRGEAERGIELLYNLDDIGDALRRLSREKVVGIDLETYRTRPYHPDSLWLSIALAGEQHSYAFAIDHPEADWSDDERDELLDMLFDFLCNAPCRKVQFTAFEMEWLAYWLGPAVLFSEWADAQGQSYLLDNRQGTLSLEIQCLSQFGLDIKALSNTDRANLDKTDLVVVLRYNAIDAKYHRRLYLRQAKLIKQRGLQAVWRHHNRRAAAAVATQLKGVPINSRTVQRLRDKYSEQKQQLEAKIDALPLIKTYNREQGKPFRPSANQDVAKALTYYAEADLKNVSEEELAKLEHPLAKLVVDLRHVAKVLSTYILPLAGEAVFPGQLLRPSLLVNRVRTWRSSSEEPNIQNFPKHDEQHREIRDMIEAPPGHRIVAFDFGQIQARNVAQESDDKALVESMWARHDIHADWRDRLLQIYPAWAAEGLNTVLSDKALMKHYRQEAKNKFVFASFFGASGRSVAGYLGVPEGIGEQLSEEFWDQFAGVKRWHQQLHRFYDDCGYVTGLTGFRRYAPVARTEIINTPIQSDEAMIVFDAYCRLVESQEPQFVPNLMVHDDLTFIWPKSKIDRYAEHVIGEMLNCSLPWAHKVPVVVEMSVGRVWSQLQETGVYESDRWDNGKAYKCRS